MIYQCIFFLVSLYSLLKLRLQKAIFKINNYFILYYTWYYTRTLNVILKREAMKMPVLVTKEKFVTSFDNYKISLFYEGIYLKNKEKKFSISELKRKYARCR